MRRAIKGGHHKYAAKSKQLFPLTMGSLCFSPARLDLLNVCGFLGLIGYWPSLELRIQILLFAMSGFTAKETGPFNLQIVVLRVFIWALLDRLTKFSSAKRQVSQN